MTASSPGHPGDLVLQRVRSSAGRGLDHLGIGLAAAILPLYLLGWRVQLPGLIVRPADLAAFTLLGLTFFRVPRASSELVRPHLLLLYSFAAYIVIQGAYLHNLGASLKESAQFLFVLLTVVAIGIHLERSPRAFHASFIALLIAAMAYTLVYHFSLGIYTRYKFSNEGRYVFGLASLLLLLTAQQARPRWPWVLGFLLSLLPLAASLERKGAFGVAVAASALLGLSLLRRLRVDWRIPLLILGVTLAALALALGESLWSDLKATWRDTVFLDEASALWVSNMHREALLLNGMDIFSKHWLWGIGADAIQRELRPYFTDPRLANASLHNFYLDYLVKYGVVGALLLFGGLAAGIARTLRQSQHVAATRLMVLYLLFVIAFISDGAAVLYLGLCTTIIGPLFAWGRAPGAVAPPSGWPEGVRY